MIIVLSPNESELNSMDNKKSKQLWIDIVHLDANKKEKKQIGKNARLIETIRDSLNPKQIETVWLYCSIFDSKKQ